MKSVVSEQVFVKIVKGLKTIVAGEKILIIDPSSGPLENVAEQILASHGFKTLLAYSQNEGVKLAVSKSPDLSLLRLPLDSALQFLQRVTQTGHSIPAILMIDQPSILMPVELLRLGVQDYVAEPYNADDILQAVRRVLARGYPRSLNFEQFTEGLMEFNQDLEQQVKKLEAVKGNGGSAGLMENLASVLNRVVEAAISVTGADTGYLFVFDENTDVLRLRAAQNLSTAQAEAFTTQLEESIVRSVARSGKPILLSGSGRHLEFKISYPIKSLLNVPLKIDEQIIGVLGVDNQTSNARFSLVDLRRLTELADMAATAVVNTHQYTEARQEIARYLEEVATLQAVTSQLSDITDFNMGAQLALSLTLRSTNAEAGVLAWLPDEQQNPLYVLQGNPAGLNGVERNGNQRQWWDEQTLQEVIKSGQPVLSYDLGHRGNGRQNHQSKTYARSRLIVPLRRGSKVMGAINLESSQAEAFTDDDLQFVARVADQLVVALEGSVWQAKADSERERFSMIMEAVDNGVWLVDADLRLMAQNEVASELLGWSEAEVVGRSPCEFESSNDGSTEGLCQLLHQAIEKRQPISYNEGLLLTTKSGAAVMIKVKIVPVVREQVVLGAICAFHLTKRSDEHVRFEFANMASHLLRTPLTSIQTSVDALLDSELAAEEQHALLNRLREQSQRMREFVKELLEMSRLEAGIVRVYVEPVTLAPLLDRVLGLIRYEEPRHDFSLSIANTLPIMAADLSKTELVLINLLRNAVSHCPDGGHVTISVETQADEVIIGVGDNGQPIPVAQLDQIFSQFYPIDSTNGTMISTYHLGLYSTKRLIELQNGRVWVESQPGKGSRFSFALPVWR